MLPFQKANVNACGDVASSDGEEQNQQHPCVWRVALSRIGLTGMVLLPIHNSHGLYRFIFWSKTAQLFKMYCSKLLTLF